MRRTIVFALLLVAITFFATLHTPSYAQEKPQDKKQPLPGCNTTDVAMLQDTRPCYIEFSKEKDSAPLFLSSISQIEEPTPTPKAEVTQKKEAVQSATTQFFANDFNKQATLSADLLFNLINDYRKKINLQPFEKNQSLCDIAQQRATEIPNELFVTGKLHAGFYARNLPYWATENLIYAKSEQQAFNWWMNSQIHRNTIVGNYKYSCCACQNEGCSQIFTSFVPKKSSTN